MINGPKLATSEFPLWGIEDFTCGLSCLNKWSYNYAYKAIWSEEKAYINEWRTRVLGLPPINGSRGLMDLIDADPKVPIIIACSSLICGPQRRIPLDYSPKVSLLGFVFPPQSHVSSSTIAPALASFIDDSAAQKKPVVYLGFGSMPAPDPARLVRLAIDICSDCNCRAILVASWTMLETPDVKALLEKNASSLLVIPSVPWSWLFPKMQCIVHHASTSMTGAALRSGVGQVPIPFMLDQPHNAKLILGLGVAPCVVHSSSHLNHKTVSAAVTKVLTNWKPKNGQGGVQEKARVFGEIVRKESEGSAQMYVDVIIRRWKAASEEKAKNAEKAKTEGGAATSTSLVVADNGPKTAI
jgi:sterol 3beta-glucosyltransferase